MRTPHPTRKRQLRYAVYIYRRSFPGQRKDYLTLLRQLDKQERDIARFGYRFFDFLDEPRLARLRKRRAAASRFHKPWD